MGYSKLSLTCVTKNSGRYIGEMLEQARLYADRVYTFVDRDSSDDTYDVCKSLSDYCELIETPGYIEPVLKYVYSVPDTPWIIRLDDDELMGQRFIDFKKEILAGQYHGYWMPRYAIVGKDRNHYIANEPMYPDYQLRLFRKGSITPLPDIHYTPLIHGNMGELGGVHIFHLKYVLKSRADREALAKHYDEISPGAGSNAAYGPHQVPEKLKGIVRKCEEEIGRVL